MENTKLTGKASLGYLALGVAIVAAITYFNSGNSAPTAGKLSPESAKYEAQKVLAVLKGRAGSAAFMDGVLKNDRAYQEIFKDGLQRTIAEAPVADPAFAPYASCVKSGAALIKFSELRKLGGGQNEESDKYRRPYWDELKLCEAAVAP